MIEVTRLNGTKFLINSNLIGTVEETPDTVLTLTDGKKIIVKDTTGVFLQGKIGISLHKKHVSYGKLTKFQKIFRKLLQFM